MQISPRCLDTLHDKNNRRIQPGQTIELKPGTRKYKRLHKVELHRAGFPMFVRDDGGYTYHAKKTTIGYRSCGRFDSENWVIVDPPATL